MVCKEEVVIWFKGLESCKRIDTMCTLLNMCLPFELRFLGTCLEELGCRDSQVLRGIELRVNNSIELAQEIASSQLGDPSDQKVRRKVAFYLALIRACNKHCVNELFNMLCAWSSNDFLKRAEGDALQELLLVYTMAANHPVFSFEQRLRCGEIYNSILSGNPDSTFSEIVSADNMHAKMISECNPSSSNPAVPVQKHILGGEQMVPVFTIPNQNVTQVAFDQNRGSQIVHREVVGIYPEGVQTGFHQTTTSNVTSFPASRSNSQLNQPPGSHASLHQQHINTSNTTNLTHSLQNLSLMDNLVYVNSDGVPLIRKSESESASSGESIEDSPPDTPLNTDLSNSGVSGNSNSSINKKIKVRTEPKMSSSRHKISAQQQQQQQQQQQHQHQHQPQPIVYANIMPQIPVSATLNSEIVLATNVTQPQPQPQPQQTITQPQPTPQTIPTAIQAIGMANQQVIFQSYAQTTHPMQKSQMNQTYPYTQQHLPINNRAPILTSNTATTAPQPAASTYRLPPYHMPPNGDMIYQLPTTFTYMPQTALPLTRPPPPPSTSNQTHTVVPPPPAPTMQQHMPTLTSLSSKSNQNTMVSPFLLASENVKPNTSCFNCGSSQHTGQECQEASMEDVTRGIYKFNYTVVNDTSKGASELDNGSEVKASDSITPSVLNK